MWGNYFWDKRTKVKKWRLEWIFHLCPRIQWIIQIRPHSSSVHGADAPKNLGDLMQQFASLSTLGVVGRLAAGPCWIETRIVSKPSWWSAPKHKNLTRRNRLRKSVHICLHFALPLFRRAVKNFWGPGVVDGGIWQTLGSNQHHRRTFTHSDPLV